jgi:hypothetical protein
MFYKLFFSLLLSAISALCLAQVKIAGVIIDKKTKKPVEYVNIGIVEKGVGTVCNEYGRFELTVPQDLRSSPITISRIGYKTSVIEIFKIEGDFTKLKIELQENVLNLNEVNVLATDEVTLGQEPDGLRVKGMFKASALGLECGTLIKNKGKVRINDFNFNVLKVPFDSLKFRLNFYTIKNDKPDAKINTKNILFTISKRDTGLFNINITEHYIQVTNNFICTIELIHTYGAMEKEAEFVFSAKPDPKGFVHKKAVSFGAWEKVKPYSLCFWYNGSKFR